MLLLPYIYYNSITALCTSIPVEVDCEIGSWGPFGNCSVNCGYGYKKRERRVLVEPRNGGKACPNTYQRRYCYGNKCKFARGTIGGIATLKGYFSKCICRHVIPRVMAYVTPCNILYAIA